MVCRLLSGGLFVEVGEVTVEVTNLVPGEQVVDVTGVCSRDCESVVVAVVVVVVVPVVMAAVVEDTSFDVELMALEF